VAAEDISTDAMVMAEAGIEGSMIDVEEGVTIGVGVGAVLVEIGGEEEEEVGTMAVVLGGVAEIEEDMMIGAVEVEAVETSVEDVIPAEACPLKIAGGVIPMHQ
jgi:hypothetical protein